jgi:hypothetical protein
MKLGSDFISGFLFGAGIGGYDEMEIYECLKKEPKARDLFNNANTELNTAVQKKDGNQAVKGLLDMILFMADMGFEQRTSI